jgi:SAM-dependent methyltransferase
MTTTDAAPWWRDYFGDMYGDLYEGVLAPRLETEAELATLRRLAAGAAGPLLDLGCGHGRHLRPMRAAGARVVGIDAAAALLRRAGGCVARGDMRRLPFRDGVFAGAWALFNTFGYFDDDGNLAVLRELRRVLAPGGWLLMDLPNRAGMRATLEESANYLHDYPAQGVRIVETWQIDATGRRMVGTGTWTAGGREQPWTVDLRLYSPGELVRMMERAGFATVEIRPAGAWKAVGTRRAAPRPRDGVWRESGQMIVLARRGE